MVVLLELLVESISSFKQTDVEYQPLLFVLALVVDNARSRLHRAASLLILLRSLLPIQHGLYAEEQRAADEHRNDELDCFIDGHSSHSTLGSYFEMYFHHGGMPGVVIHVKAKPQSPVSRMI